MLGDFELLAISIFLQVVSDFVENWTLMYTYFVVTNIKTLEEKRGVPLPRIPSVDLEPKSKKVDKIQKADKSELSERHSSPLPSIQTSIDVSCQMERSQELNCPVVIVMGVYCNH